MAYDKISINYFYLSDLKKAKYYKDRMMRGFFEGKDSKLRAIYENQMKNKRAERKHFANSITPFVDTKNVFQIFEENLVQHQERMRSHQEVASRQARERAG